MYFTFSATAIASIFGAATLADGSLSKSAASFNAAYDSGDISYNRKTAPRVLRGGECSVGYVPQGEREAADAGILVCDESMACIEDETSTTGGRCVSLENAPILESERQLIYDGLPLQCTFADGTTGFYCSPDAGCPADKSSIGCGSCLGYEACKDLGEGTTIGEKSCIGYASCRSLLGTVEDNSCDSLNQTGSDLFTTGWSCEYFNGTIGSYSCRGYASCYGSNATVAHYSCLGYFACSEIVHADVGSQSCVGSEACDDLFSGTIIGDYSCLGYETCQELNGTVANGSCHSLDQAGPYNKTGWSCESFTGNIGFNSCHGYVACEYSNANIGDSSCIGSYTCYNNTGQIKDCNCIGDYACRDNTDDLEGKCIPRVQKVRLDSITGQPIQVSEVQVFFSGDNVALNKPAAQSSTYKKRSRFHAGSAVDGDESSFSHTNRGDGNAYWEVDLEGMFPIDSITIKNRYCRDPDDPTNCLCRLSHSILSMWDDKGEWVATKIIGDTCGKHELNFSFPSLDTCNKRMVDMLM